jgi:hypothetical protein
VGNAVGILGVVLVYDHLSRLSIQSVKPCRRSDPKKSLRIRLYRQNLVVCASYLDRTRDAGNSQTGEGPFETG